MSLSQYRSKVILSNKKYGDYTISYADIKKQQLTKGGKIKSTIHFNGTETENKLSRDISGTTVPMYEITLQINEDLRKRLEEISSVDSGITTLETSQGKSQVVLEEMPQISMLGETSTLMFIIEKEL